MRLRSIPVLAAAVVGISACATTPAATPTVTAPATAPLIYPSGAGLQKKTNLRVVYGVGEKKLRQGMGEGLFFAKRLIDAWQREGVADSERVFVVTVYNESAEWLLNDAAWKRAHPDTPDSTNHSAALVAELIQRGVHVEVCGMTMKQKGWVEADLLPGIVVVGGAYARIVDLQHQGFAYIPFF